VDHVEDPYEVLGVPRDADAEAITAAYRRLVREHHPDIFVNDDPDQRARRHQRMASINAAYRILNDPRELERFQKMRQRRPHAGAPPGAGRDTDTAGSGTTGTSSSAAGSRPRDDDATATGGSFDYRQRAPSEFDVRRDPVEERETRKAQRWFGRRRRRS
jgi:curved DNA-binding protein CbpA